jgi:putative flippase GtrA
MIFRRLMSRRLVSFIGVGAVATLVQYCILVFSVEILGLRPFLGSSVGFAVSAVLNYWLNYHFTFRSQNSHVGAVSRFALVALAGLVLNALAMVLLGRVQGLPYVAAQIIATVIVLAWNFLGNSLWTFAHRHEYRTKKIIGDAK